MTLIEAAHDLCEGASKGNTGIATSGGDCHPGTLELELVRRSSPGWEALCARLDTPFHRIGTLAVALTEEDERRLPELLRDAQDTGAAAEIVTGDQARALEPLISEQARAALHFPDDGIIDSIRLTIGYAELAARNGVEVLRGAPVHSIERDGDRIVAVTAGDRRIATRSVVNAAGVEADTISRLAGGEQFRTWPRQGQYWLLDRELGGRFRKVVGGVPTPVTRGIYCVPTTNRSLLLGPTAVDHEDRSDRAVDTETLDHVFDAAQRLVPSIGREHAIKTFAVQPPGLRSHLPDRRRRRGREPGARGRHPLDGGVVLTGRRRDGARAAGRAGPAGRRCSGRTRSPSWSRCRGCSGIPAPSSCSPATRATAR